MNLKSNYLGLELKHPLIAGASPLSDDVNKVRMLEDAGAAAIVMYSLFEEQILHNTLGAESHINAYENSFSEAASYFPESDLFDLDVDTYLGQLQKVKAACDLPVIASLNGTREGDWVNYASLIQNSGADALELNLYFLATDLDESASDLEDRCVRIVEAVKQQITIPLAVKLSPYFTALPHFANRLSQAGANALVLFNRFYQPDIDADELDIEPRLQLSNSPELLPRLRWLALLHDRIDCDLSVSGGVHTGIDAVKALMAGADSVQMVSALLMNGPAYIGTVLQEVKDWMEEKEYTNIDDLRGCMSYLRAPDPEALERANYLRILKSWRARW
ncbi:dihydroorotate dehydrogenase-like protein [Coraliomargarita akajimensis]|uniref:Dihydroorotate oxidase n=1 Tax=Coraliomargarita akajimensis (strain DSM 45221 / IAM 15411 / JCM 23193 / KCTC 12865 / 04OKA010-24) TaxID=583355 RepID=D5EIA6_CORAD|nr:dihydroorotate dehydrogenase-like protein [Coraliomargarita akajimensis]ADE54172.1 dihydroorotate oxidase [Coraliomargarita akajimensis DSM 45221]